MTMSKWGGDLVSISYRSSKKGERKANEFPLLSDIFHLPFHFFILFYFIFTLLLSLIKAMKSVRPLYASQEKTRNRDRLIDQ